MSLRLPEKIETELMAEVLDAINSDEEFVVTSAAYHRADSEPGVQIDEADRQVVMLCCRPASAGSFSVDPMTIARLLTLPVVQLFQRDGETFLRVCGVYEGFVTLVDFFTTPMTD